jgi:hypothetical protein
MIKRPIFVLISRLAFPFLVLNLIGASAFAQSVEPVITCSASLVAKPERAWQIIENESQRAGHGVFDFKPADYNEVLYFLNYLGGVTRLPSYYSSTHPNLLITVVGLGGRRFDISEEYMAEMVPKMGRFFDLVVNFSGNSRYEAMASSEEILDQLREKAEEAASPSAAAPKKSWVQRVVGRFQAIDEKIFDSTDSHTPEEKKLIAKKPLIKNLPSLFPSSTAPHWVLLFVDKQTEEDLADQLANSGFKYSVRVIDHLHVNRDYK